MTSKNLFFNLMKEDLRRRLWTVILASIVFFFSMPVATMVMLQHYLLRLKAGDTFGGDKTQQMLQIGRTIGGYFGDSNLLFAVIAVAGAIICGISGYAFLHSKKQVDFYHSLPIRRETVFFVHFVDGIFIYFIPYTVGLLLSLLMCAVFGAAGGGMLSMCLGGMLLHLMGFLLCYLVTVLATLLTGKLLLNFFGVLVLFFYAPAVYGLVEIYKLTFWTTLYNGYAGFGDAFFKVRYFSPISHYAWLVANFEDGSAKEIGMAVLGFAVTIVLLLAACVFLYKRRKSEKAGNAMAFAVSEPIIRILLAVPAGLGFGILFLMLQYQDTSTFVNSCLWLGFGSLIGAFLAHGIIESLYQFDVKKCLSHKLQLAGTVLVTVVIAMSFLNDWFHFDSYLPKKEDVRAMAVNCYELTAENSYYNKGHYQNGIEYTMEHMELESFDAAYEIARLCSTYAAGHREIGGSTWVPGQYPITITVKYELRNGKKVFRSYRYDAYEIMDLLAEVYRQEEYKKANYQVLRLEELGLRATRIYCKKAMKEVSLTLTQAERNELLSLFQKELLAMEFSELITTPPVGRMGIEALWGREAEGESDDYWVYLYPSMRGTLEFLGKHGFDVDRIATAQEAEAIYIPYAVKQGSSTVNGKSATYYADEIASSSPELEITDAAEIAECMKYLVLDVYASAVPFRQGAFGSYGRSCHVTFRLDDYGNQWTGRYYFTELPDFVAERLAKLEGEER